MHLTEKDRKLAAFETDFVHCAIGDHWIMDSPQTLDPVLE